MGPFMVGAEGFRFKYFHWESCGICVLLWVIVFLISFWKIFVGPVLLVWKWFPFLKFCTFVS
jgi:hypothetical protein